MSGNSNLLLRRFFLTIVIASLIATAVLITLGKGAATGPVVVGFFTALALYTRKHPTLGVISFSIWMSAFVAAPIYYPGLFLIWGPVKMSTMVMPLIMFVLFCMGTTMSLDDFRRVLTMPHAVLIGVVLTFTLMPLIGKIVAMALHADSEIAAGMVLVGASPGGVASNVITYLARGNVALSVTMTACETILSPIVTPALTQWFAGAYIEINFWNMVVSIFKMVIIPVAGGLFAHSILERLGRVHPFYDRMYRFIMSMLPLLSMAAIVLVCAILTANARDQLLVGSVIFTVLVSVALQNGLGLISGYWIARLFRLGEKECRTVAIEVGLKNSGMAAALALNVLHSSLASIPGVVYSSWHNITGALAASYWAHQTEKEEQGE